MRFKTARKHGLVKFNCKLTLRFTKYTRPDNSILIWIQIKKSKAIYIAFSVTTVNTCIPPLSARTAGEKYKTVINVTKMARNAILVIAVILNKIIVVKVVVISVMGVTRMARA